MGRRAPKHTTVEYVDLPPPKKEVEKTVLLVTKMFVDEEGYIFYSYQQLMKAVVDGE